MRSALELVAAAEREITTLSLGEVRAAMDDPDTVIVDIRDVRELWRDGKIPGAMHSPRGMNEFWIDPASPYQAGLCERQTLRALLCWRMALSAGSQNV